MAKLSCCSQTWLERVGNFAKKLPGIEAANSQWLQSISFLYFPNYSWTSFYLLFQVLQLLYTCDCICEHSHGSVFHKLRRQTTFIKGNNTTHWYRPVTGRKDLWQIKWTSVEVSCGEETVQLWDDVRKCKYLKDAVCLLDQWIIESREHWHFGKPCPSVYGLAKADIPAIFKFDDPLGEK